MRKLRLSRTMSQEPPSLLTCVAMSTFLTFWLTIIYGFLTNAERRDGVINLLIVFFPALALVVAWRIYRFGLSSTGGPFFRFRRVGERGVPARAGSTKTNRSQAQVYRPNRSRVRAPREGQYLRWRKLTDVY